MGKSKNGSKKRNLRKLTQRVSLGFSLLSVLVLVLLVQANGGHTPSSEIYLNLGITSLVLTLLSSVFAFRNWLD